MKNVLGNWTVKHRVFVVEALIKNNGSVIVTQKYFCTHFGLDRHAPVSDRITILLWVANFGATGSALKRKHPGRPRNARTPENIYGVGESVLRSPKRSAVKNASVVHSLDRNVRRILQADLKFHPYKMMVVQELSKRVWENCKSCCNDILQNVPENGVLITSDEAHFNLCGTVNKQNVRHSAVP
ncbi:hypothetical protein ILUMI_06893 [Ignelater luminosus]|uniref:DUF4817 domain-containing protein n=1 Tax=Ignelater luminosus TaxID=2038154 RepID=A0A8K0D935_IGNLU|nr:hypothetical protein ILUMI_06893 [Ignelater luminosus]